MFVLSRQIGGSNYFWSFPAKKDRLAQIQHQQTLAQIEKLQGELGEATAQLADAKRGREEDGEGGRAAKLARLATMAKECVSLEQEYEKLKENDPKFLADLEKELDLVTQAANRWTDNIFNCQQYLIKKKQMQKKETVSVLSPCHPFVIFRTMDDPHATVCFAFFFVVVPFAWYYECL